MAEAKDKPADPKELTSEDILNTNDLELLEVYVPEWKGTVWMRVFPADEGIELNDRMQALPKDKDREAIFHILAACIVNSKGECLFKSPDELRSRSQKVLVRLQKQAIELQGWNQEASAKNA